MEGGWYSFKFVRPVYIDEEVREVGSELLADGTLPLQVEARDGRLCCDGAAGLGATLPWDASREGTRGTEKVFPAMAIGEASEPSELRVTPDEVAAMIAAAGDPTPWYCAASCHIPSNLDHDTVKCHRDAGGLIAEPVSGPTKTH